jgi:hypothetical protein
MVLMLATTLFLARWGGFQRLGDPGIRLNAENIYFEPTDKVDLPLVERLAGTNVVALPESLPGFRSEPLPLQQIVVEKLPADTTYGQRRYIDESGSLPLNFVDNLVVLMGADRTSIHQPQYCLTGQGWKIMKQEAAVIPMTRPHSYQLEVKKLTASRQHRLPDGRSVALSGVFVYWFVADGKLSTEHHDRMMSMATSLLTRGVLERWAYVTYFAPCWPGEEAQAFSRLKKLIQTTVPEYQLAAGPPPDGLAARSIP